MAIPSYRPAHVSSSHTLSKFFKRSKMRPVTSSCERPDEEA